MPPPDNRLLSAAVPPLPPRRNRPPDAGVGMLLLVTSLAFVQQVLDNREEPDCRKGDGSLQEEGGRGRRGLEREQNAKIKVIHKKKKFMG